MLRTSEPWDAYDVRAACRSIYAKIPAGALYDAVLLHRQGRISALPVRPRGSLGTLCGMGLAEHGQDDAGWCVRPTPLFAAFMATVREVCNGR